MTTPTDSDSTAKLLAATSAILGALSGAVDDLNRAALVLRQEARPSGERFRTPEDMRRIAEQFSDRARNSRASYEAAISVCRAIVATRHPAS